MRGLRAPLWLAYSVKNKVAPPFKESEFDIYYGEGISHTGELVDLGVKYEIITKSGAWFSMGETRLGQGRDAARQYFVDHPDIADEVEKQIKAKAEEQQKNNKASPASKLVKSQDGDVGPGRAIPIEELQNAAENPESISLDDEFADLAAE